ncbi:MAG: hypothetical protein QOC93_856 [Actinomycetota bacterium]|jgi:hypothetical protein|nr:hypothetical protein [Actinomycetota bacterium]
MSTTGAGRGWAYGGLLLGGAVSIAANVAHSYVPPPGAGAGWAPHGGAVVSAVFWPVLLLVAVEVMARTPWPGGWQSIALRFAGLPPVALVAALVSYRHMAGLLGFYGEDTLTAALGPLAVDGLMVMATGALIATSPARTPHPALDTRPDTGTAQHTAPDTDTAPDMTADPDPWPEPDTEPAVTSQNDPADGARPSRVDASSGTAAAVARLHAADPGLSAAAIAVRLGVSDRTVRRHLARLTARPPLHLLPAGPGPDPSGGAP